MIAFWLICAALIAISLRFILSPLQRSIPSLTADGVAEANLALYREQLAEMALELSLGTIEANQFAQDREELARRLLDDVSSQQPEVETRQAADDSRKLRIALAAFMPSLAIVLYVSLGSPGALSQTAAPAAIQSTGMSSERMQRNVEALAKRLAQNPNDTEGWLMLARSYLTLEKYSEAVGAFERVETLVNNDPDSLADYAFALSAGKDLHASARASEMIQRALQLDPGNANALALAGNLAFEARDYRRAIAYWERLQRMVPSGSDLEQTLAQRVLEAKTLASD